MITSGDQNPGGTNVFEIWAANDVMPNQAGDPVSLVGAWWENPGWLHLNDAAGSAAQTLGIERTVNTIAGATYSFEFHSAGIPGYAAGEVALDVYLDGVLLDTVDHTSDPEGLTWHGNYFEFVGTGGAQVLRLVSRSSSFTAEGRGVFVDNIKLWEDTPNTGAMNSEIALQTVVGYLVDTDESESLEMYVSGIPVGATLRDETHSFTATAGNQSVNISGWNKWEISITPPTDFFGIINLTFTARAVESYSTSTADTVRTLTVQVLAAPSATGQTITLTEDVPYVFQWADFGVSDLDSTDLWVRIDDHASNGYFQEFDGVSWRQYTWRDLHRSEIEAGVLRLVPNEHESGDGGTMPYSIHDGQQWSSSTTMTINVTPVADAPVLQVSGAGDGKSEELFCIGFESVLDEGTGPTIVNASTLEGWTMITGPDRAAGGTNAFEVWTDGDQTTNADGDLTTMHASASHPGDLNWISLADASGSGIQTLGIERTLNTTAGMIYTLSMDMAGDSRFGAEYTGVKIIINDVEMCVEYPTCTDDGLCWENYSFQFAGTGSAMTIRIMAFADTFAPEGRGVMIDNINVHEQLPNMGAQDSTIGLQYVQSWLVDEDGSEDFELVVEGIPVGATLTDHAYSFTATAGNTSVNIEGWDLWDLNVTPPPGFHGSFNLTVRATARELANSSTANSIRTLTVNVLATPVAAPQTISSAEDTPYYFQWADFGASDPDSSDLVVYIETQPTNGFVEFLSGDCWLSWYHGEVTRAQIDAGHLRFISNLNESGVVGTMDYSVGDGLQWSAIASMTLNVTPVTDVPCLELSGAGQGTSTELFCIGFESVLDSGTGPTIVNASTLEGWTLMTAPDRAAGGTNAFEVWTEGDQVTNADGNLTTMLASESHPADLNWISLADASGGGTQTLGIERTISTIAGAVYTLAMDMAGEPRFAGEFTGMKVVVNGEVIGIRYPTCTDDGLCWCNYGFEFEGTGAAMTIQIMAFADQFAPEGRGVMIDNINLHEQIPNTGFKNSPIYLQGVSASTEDNDGSETFSVFIDGIPVGATLTDDTYTFTATTGNTSVNITDWDGHGLRIQGALDYFGNFDLTVRAVATETSTGLSSTRTRTMHVHVLNQTSPIVLDLDGNGIQTIALENTQGTFDLLNTGTPVRSGWISSGDAFLAVDLNRNGRIDNRDELFGGELGEGFAKLASYDSNGDGTVNKKDARFKDLRVWQDKNGNHRTDKGELKTLKQAGVKSLNTGYSVNEETQNGNQFIERGTAVRSNGQTIEMSDVYFPTAPAGEGVGASFGPQWQESGDKTARIVVESMLRGDGAARSQSVLDRMLNSFAPARAAASVDMKLPATPSLKSAQSVHSSPKPDPHGDKHDGSPRSSPKPDPASSAKQDDRSGAVEPEAGPAYAAAGTDHRLACAAAHGRHPERRGRYTDARSRMAGRHSRRQARQEAGPREGHRTQHPRADPLGLRAPVFRHIYTRSDFHGQDHLRTPRRGIREAPGGRRARA